MKKMMSVLLVVLLIFSVMLTGCSKTEDSEVGKETDNQVQDQNEEPTSEEDPDTPKVNTDRVWRTTGGWNVPPEFHNNPMTGTQGSLHGYFYDNLFQLNSYTGEIYYRLAEDLKFEGNKATIKIRENAYWNDGEPFTSKDVWAFYVLLNGKGLGLIESIDTPDDKTVVITYREPMVSKDRIIKLLASDTIGFCPYHIYKEFVDRAWEYWQSLPTSRNLEDKPGFMWTVREPGDKRLDKIKQEMAFFDPGKIVGAGPYNLVTVTASDAILEKNPYYWNADNVKFDRVELKMVSAEAAIALITEGEFESYGGLLPYDMLLNILESNEDMVLQVTPAMSRTGIYFNTSKYPFNLKEVRRAIAFAMDKEKIVQAEHPLYETSDIASSANLTNTDFERYIPDEVKNAITRYTHDLEKAENELKSIGWSRNEDGLWQDENGETFEFELQLAMAHNAGTVLADQLTKFGLPTKVQSMDPAVMTQLGTAPDATHDMIIWEVDWVAPFAEPWQNIREYYFAYYSRMMQFNRDDNDGLDMQIKGFYRDEEFDIRDFMYDEFMYIQDEEEYKKAVADLVYAANENVFSLRLFENVGAQWYNTKTIGGIPKRMEEAIGKSAEERLIIVDYSETDSIYEIAPYIWGGFQVIIDGTLYPR